MSAHLNAEIFVIRRDLLAGLKTRYRNNHDESRQVLVNIFSQDDQMKQDRKVEIEAV